jgi:hypothetical protein
MSMSMSSFDVSRCGIVDALEFTGAAYGPSSGLVKLAADASAVDPLKTG